MQTIKAAVCKAFGEPMVIEDVQLAPPKTGEVEVTLDAVAICHSDISFAEGAWGGHLPAVYGHEAAGVISAVGEAAGEFRVGDPVVVTLIRACGSCPTCAGGQPTICETPYDTVNGPLRTSDGGPLEQAMACGAFAEKVVVSHRQIVKNSRKPAQGSGKLAVLRSHHRCRCCRERGRFAPRAGWWWSSVPAASGLTRFRVHE